MPNTYDIIIIGGGVTGCAMAFGGSRSILPQFVEVGWKPTRSLARRASMC